MRDTSEQILGGPVSRFATARPAASSRNRVAGFLARVAGATAVALFVSRADVLEVVSRWWLRTALFVVLTFGLGALLRWLVRPERQGRARFLPGDKSEPTLPILATGLHRFFQMFDRFCDRRWIPIVVLSVAAITFQVFVLSPVPELPTDTICAEPGPEDELACNVTAASQDLAAITATFSDVDADERDTDRSDTDQSDTDQSDTKISDSLFMVVNTLETVVDKKTLDVVEMEGERPDAVTGLLASLDQSNALLSVARAEVSLAEAATNTATELSEESGAVIGATDAGSGTGSEAVAPDPDGSPTDLVGELLAQAVDERAEARASLGRAIDTTAEAIDILEVVTQRVPRGPDWAAFFALLAMIAVGAFLAVACAQGLADEMGEHQLIVRPSARPAGLIRLIAGCAALSVVLVGVAAYFLQGVFVAPGPDRIDLWVHLLLMASVLPAIAAVAFASADAFSLRALAPLVVASTLNAARPLADWSDFHEIIVITAAAIASLALMTPRFRSSYSLLTLTISGVCVGALLIIGSSQPDDAGTTLIDKFSQAFGRTTAQGPAVIGIALVAISLVGFLLSRYISVWGTAAVIGAVAAVLLALYRNAAFSNRFYGAGLLIALLGVIIVTRNFGSGVARVSMGLWIAAAAIFVGSYGLANPPPDVAEETVRRGGHHLVADGIGAGVNRTVSIIGSIPNILTPPDGSELLESEPLESEPLGSEPLESGPGLAHIPRNVSWAIGLLAALALVRWLNLLNAMRSAWPVTVGEFVVPADVKDADRLTSDFKARLAASAVAEPSTLPGANLSEEFIDLFSGTETMTWWTPLVRAARLATPRRGITAVPTLAIVEDGTARITVEIRWTHSSRHIRTTTTIDGDLDRAIERAAVDVAQLANDLGRTTPAWSNWRGAEPGAFYSYLLAKNAFHHQGAMTAKQARSALSRALSLSPTTGLVRVELGHQHTLADEPWQALRVHLEAAEDHPRMVIARYRVITALSMLAPRIEHRGLSGASAEERFAIAGSLERQRMLARARTSVHWDGSNIGASFELLRGGPPAGEDARRSLSALTLCIALDEVDRLRASLWLPNIAFLARRQSERTQWVRYLTTERRRRELERLETVGVIVEWKLVALLSDEAQRVAKFRHLAVVVNRILARTGVDAVAVYNTACFFALAPEPDRHPEWHDRAIDLLHLSRRLPSVESPSLEWIVVDPDLEPLHRHPRFREFEEWLTRAAGSAAGPTGNRPTDGTASRSGTGSDQTASEIDLRLTRTRPGGSND